MSDFVLSIEITSQSQLFYDNVLIISGLESNFPDKLFCRLMNQKLY